MFAANFGQVRAEMAQLRAELRGEMSQLRTEFLGELKVKLHEQETRLIGWMFRFWLGQIAVTIGLILAARQIWN